MVAHMLVVADEAGRSLGHVVIATVTLPGGVVEKASKGRTLVLLRVGLRGATQRAHVLEHTFRIRPSLGVR